MAGCGGHRALVALGELCDPGQLHAALADVESGLRSWAVDPAVCDLDQQLKLFISRHSARSSAQVKGEKTLQHRSDVLETSVLLNPSENTLVGEVRALLLSPEHHKLLLLAGVGLEDTGDLVLQDGFFSCRHLLNICTDDEVQESLSAAFPGQRAELTLCCSVADSASWGSLPSDGGVVSSALAVAVNPPALLPPGMEGACELSEYLAESWETPSPFGVLEAPASGGFLKLSRPCCYVFPGGRGDAALFAINGFTLLVDGGSERRAGFWKLARHLDRLDALLLTHIGADNLPGVNALLERKVAEAEAQGGEGGRPPGATSPEWLRNLVSPELGVVFFNVPDKMGQSGDPAANVRRGLDEACVTLQHLSQLGIQPEPLFRTNSPTLEPIILFQKLGVGRLEMYVLNPVKDSKEMQFMLQKWNGNSKAKSGVVMPNGKESEVSVPYLTSVAVLLVWHPASPTERIVRTLFPGNAPQNKILEGLEKLKHLEVLKHPVVTQRDLASGAAAQAKPFQLKPKNRTDSKESLKMSSRSGTAREAKKEQTAAMVRVDSKTELAKTSRAEKTQAIPAAVKSSAAGRPDTGNKAGAERAKAEVKPKVAKEPAIGKDSKDKLQKPTKKDIKKEESKDDKKDVKDTKASKEVKKDVKPVKKPELKASASDTKKPIGKTTAPRKDSADMKKPVALAAKATEAKKTKVQIKPAKPKGKADQIVTAAKEQTPISSPEDLTKDFDEVKKDGVEFKQSTEEIIPSPQEEVLVVSQKTDNVGMSLVSPDEGITTTDAEPSPHEEETPCHRENSAHLEGEEYDVGGKCHMDANGGRELAYQGGNNVHEAPAVTKAESADSDLADDDEMLREDERSDDDGEMVEEPETAEASPVGSPKTGGAVFASSRAEFDPDVQNKSFPPVSSMLDGDGLDKNVLQFHQSDNKDWAPSEHNSQHFQQLDNEKGASPHHHTASDVPSQSQDGGSPAVESPEHIRGEVNVDTFTTSSDIPLDKTPASDRSVKFDLTPMEISQKGGLLSNLDDTLPALYELPSIGSNIFGGGVEETRSLSSTPLSAGNTPYTQSPLVEDSLLVEGSNKVTSVPALPKSPHKLFPEMALHSVSGHEEASAVNHGERSSDGLIVGVLENGSTFKEYEKDGFASEEIVSGAVVDGASHKVATKFKEAVPQEAHFSLSLSGNPFEEARAPLIEVSPTRADDTSQLFSAREESKMSISAASLSDRSVTPTTDEAAIMAAVSASTTSLATSSFLDPFTAATTGDEVSPSLHAEVGSPHSTEVDESLSVSMEQVPASLPDPEQSHRDPSDPRPMSISPPEMSPRPSTLAEPRGALASIASIASNGPTEVDFSPFDVDVITPQSQFFQGNSPSPSSSATPSPVRVMCSMAEGLSEAPHRDAEADMEENEVDVEEEAAPPYARAFDGLGGPNNHNDEDNVDDDDDEEEEDVDESPHDVDLCLVASCEFQHHREGLQHSGVTQSPVDFSDDSEHSQDRAKPADSFYRPSSNQYNSGGLSFGPSPAEETPPTSASESLPTRSDSDIPPGTEDCTAEAAQDSEDDSDCLPSDKTSSDKSNKSVRVDARSRIDASPSASVDPFPPPPDPNVCMADPETQAADLDKPSKKDGKRNPKASAKGAKKPDGKAKPSAAQPKGAAGKEKPTSKPNKVAETKITKQDKEAKNGVNVNASRGGAGQTKATGTGAGKPVGLLASYPSGPPVYVDLAYVPNHCSAKTADVEFFRRVRSAHYVVSGNDLASEEPSRSVLDCLLEAKAQWGNNALQVTLIPTHDTEVMREWYQESHARLKELSIMVLASSSTVVMQEESFPACKIEF